MNASADHLPVLDVTPLQTSLARRGIGAYLRGLLEGTAALDATPSTWGFAVPYGPNGSRAHRAVPRVAGGLWSSWPQLAAWGGRNFGPFDLPHFTSILASGVRPAGPYLATVYDFIPHRFPGEYLRTPWRRWLYGRYLEHLRGAVHLLAISEAVADEAAEVLGRDLGDISVTPLGVPHLPEPTGSTGGEPYLLAAGTPQPHKNLAFALEVVASLPVGRRPPVVVTGYDGDRRWRQLLAQAAETGVRVDPRPRVTRQELADLYAGTAAVLVPSRYEGFGLQAVEALSVGARVLCSDRGALPEVAGPAEVLPLDMEAWRERILAIIGGEAHDPEPGRAWASGFTWERTARTTLDAYRRMT